MINLQKLVIRIVSRSSFDARANPIYFWKLTNSKIGWCSDQTPNRLSYVPLYKRPSSLLTVSMTYFCFAVTYIHITLEVRIPSVCPTSGQMKGYFHFVFKGPKCLIPLALKFRMPLVLVCLIRNLSHFSWYKHTLALLMLVWSFSLLSLFFSFLHLHVQPFLFLSYLMIIFYDGNKLCVFRVKLPMSVL